MASFPPTRQFRRDEATKGRRDGNQEGEEQAPDGRPAPCAGSRPARAQVALADQARDGDSPLDDQARDREPPRGVDQDVLRTQVQPVRPPRRMPGPGDVRAPGLYPPVRRPRTALQGGLVPALRGGAPPPPRRRAVRRNGCPDEPRRRLRKFHYPHRLAHEGYRRTLVESRQGVNATEGELRAIDKDARGAPSRTSSPRTRACRSRRPTRWKAAGATSTSC